MQTFYNFSKNKQFFNLRPTAKKMAEEIGFDLNGSVNISSTIEDLVQMISAIGNDLDISMKAVKIGKNSGIEFSISALTDNKMGSNFSINGHLGSGFINIKRKMDNFCISSSCGEIRLVTRKWIPVA